ncbi:MAG: deoxyuridine 5'-triphosphate nucleotidohydrolase [Eubacteriales bacterium]|nr:deoxyuridine 5'-triphosphate nucleotidohydrolase [Eubacteriales bacterium]
MPEKIKITYVSKEIEKLCYIDGKSDWIDLRAAEHVVLKKGEFRLISLGVSMCLPDGYEAVVVPRSSTFKNFGIIQTNSCGVIDESYGKFSSSDVWKMPVLAVRDTEINVNDRICQFRIQKHQPEIIFEEVELHDDESLGRGGFGTTGKN